MNHHDPSLEDLVDRATPESAPPFGDVLARRRRRRTHRRAAAGGVAAVAVVVAVAAGATLLGGGADTDPDPAPAPTASDRNDDPAPSPQLVAPDWDGTGVPPLTLLLEDRMVVMAPWSYCYGNACIDGMPPKGLDHVGSPDTVRFSFPEPGWTFEATFKQHRNSCGRNITVPVTAIDEHTFEVAAAGPPESWDVDLFGRGPDGGDVIYTFGWTTLTLGDLAEPDAYLGIVSVTGDETHVYAPELAVNDLARTPDEATAVITVTAADGATHTLPPLHPEPGCSDGSLFFRGPDSLTEALKSLTATPVAYTVELTMDGTTYTGTAVYPDDEIKGLEPYTALTFDPPLPAYTG